MRASALNEGEEEESSAGEDAGERAAVECEETSIRALLPK